MPITPTGDPAWVRNVEHTTYGGHTDKTNYQSRGVVNALTDVGAEGFVRMVSDLAAVVRTLPFCVINITGRDSGAGDVLVNRVNLQTGTTAVAYAGASPPTGFPTVTLIGSGHYRITFDATYSDDYSVSGAFAPTHCVLGLEGSTPYDLSYDVSGSLVDVYVTSSGAPILDQTLSVAVW